MSQELTLELSKLINQYSPGDLTLDEAKNLAVKLAQIVAAPKVWRLEKVVQ